MAGAVKTPDLPFVYVRHPFPSRGRRCTDPRVVRLTPVSQGLDVPAIEFDPLVASGDVLYDLAFLLMDLVERGLPEAANGVLNGYFAAARRDEDCEGLAALPLFMSLRAAIRAMVTAAPLEVSPVKPV